MGRMPWETCCPSRIRASGIRGASSSAWYRGPMAWWNSMCRPRQGRSPRKASHGETKEDTGGEFKNGRNDPLHTALEDQRNGETGVDSWVETPTSVGENRMERIRHQYRCWYKAN